MRADDRTGEIRGEEKALTTGVRRRAGPTVHLLLFGVAACGGGSSAPTTPTPSPGSGGATTITITAAGVSPKTMTVSLGARVTFVNNDSRNHDMSSDPHPDHTDCIEINQVGLLRPGQSRETGNLVVARSCGFHDHDLPSVESLKGTITIR